MDIFEQNKLLKRAVVFFAMLNLGALGFFVWHNGAGRDNRPPRPDGDYHDVSGLLQKELGLSSRQVEQFQDLRKFYFEREMTLSRSIKEERDSMNVIMFNKLTDSLLIKSLAANIAANEYQMELMRFQQANELKKICNPQQLEKFERLVIEIRDYFRPDNLPSK